MLLKVKTLYLSSDQLRSAQGRAYFWSDQELIRRMKPQMSLSKMSEHRDWGYFRATEILASLRIGYQFYHKINLGAKHGAKLIRPRQP